MAYATLALIQPLDPATGNRVNIYVSSLNDAVDARKVNGLNSVMWEPAITQAPTLSISVWNGDFQNAVSLGSANIPINMTVVKNSFPSVDTYYWEAAPVTIYAEQPGTAWPWTTRFKGIITGYTRKSQVLTITANVDTKALEANVLTAAYAGTGGIEGGADIKNKLKPLIFGWASNVEPVLIDAVNNVYQFCAYGAMEAITTLYERGSAFSAAQADYADYTALVAATIPPGKWGTCLASGLIRLGAPAYGVITGDVKGYKVSTATPRKTGAIINAAVTIAGVSTSFINTSSLTALDTAAAYNVNIVLTDQITLLELAQRMILPLNWQCGVNFDGTLFASQITLTGTPVLSLNAAGTTFPQVQASDELDVTVPYYKTIMAANRSWRVHTADEIATSALLVERGLYNEATTYREGNIVSLQDGSTWVYISTVPAAGNIPPTWPTTSNAFWSNVSPRTGRVTQGGNVPSVANSVLGDTHIGDDGTIYFRINPGGILLGGFAVTLAGFRPQLAWTTAPSQPIRDTIAQANAAAASAAAANTELSNIASDNLITKGEKPAVILDYTTIINEQAGIDAQATALSITTEKTAYDSAITALTAYLATLTTPVAWNNTGGDTTIVGTTFRTNFAAVYTARQTLLNKIDAIASTKSTWGGISGLVADATDLGNLATQDAVDPATSQVLMKGSVTPTVMDIGFTYTSTTSQIVISWTAFTIYRADGTTVSVSSGSQTITGLAASTSYKFFPYMVDSGGTSGSVSWVSGSVGASWQGSPAIAGVIGAAGGITATVTMNAQGNVPLGSFVASTPSSGSGGGGGGGFNCLHPSMMVGNILAGHLDQYSLVPAPEGLVRVQSVTRLACSKWIALWSGDIEVARVTPEHIFYRAGSRIPIKAIDVSLGDMLAAQGDHVGITRLELDENVEMLVGIDVGGDHLHYAGPMNLLCHNGNAKP